MQIAGWRPAYERDPVGAVRGLTEELAEALEAVTLPMGAGEDEALLDAGEALYAAERGLERGGDDDRLAARLPRLQIFAGGMNWLRAHDPERLRRLTAAVRAYRARLARLGLEEGELPEGETRGDMLRAMGTNFLLAILGLPIVALGIAAWYLPYMSPQLVLRFHRPAYEALATIKLVTALITFPLFYIAWVILAERAGGPWLAVAVAIVLPMAGLATLHWREHWHEFRQEARFLFHALRHRRLAAQLRAQRGAIADSIDRVADEWEAETQRRIPERAGRQP
jgi:hypothetical protein